MPQLLVLLHCQWGDISVVKSRLSVLIYSGYRSDNKQVLEPGDILAVQSHASEIILIPTQLCVACSLSLSLTFTKKKQQRWEAHPPAFKMNFLRDKGALSEPRW